jgi:hypothetical protein
MNKIKLYVLIVYTVLGLHAQPHYINSILASYSDTSIPIDNGSLNSFWDAALMYDFNSDGYPDIIAFQNVPYITNSTSPAVAVRAYKNINNSFIDTTYNILGNITMYTPSDWIVADFDGDGKLDLFVSDCGLDAAPWPGGQTRLFVQSPDC